MQIKVLVNGKSKHIGTLENRVLTLKRNSEKHLFRGGHVSVADARKIGTAAWGIDKSIVDQYAEVIDTIVIEITNEGRNISCDFSKFAVGNPDRYIREFKGQHAQIFVKENVFK